MGCGSSSRNIQKEYDEANEAADDIARNMGFFTNKEVLNHPMNKVDASFRDARSAAQRSPANEERYNRKFEWQGVQTKRPEDILKPLPQGLWSILGVHRELDYQKALEDELDYGPEKPWTDMQPAQGLIAWNATFPFIFGITQKGRWENDKFLALSRFLNCPIVDRTGTLTGSPLKLKSIFPIPAVDPNFNMQWEEIMDARAQNILDSIPPDADIHVLWSGGIDTTALVCAFIRISRARVDKRIIIRYAERSIKEYPWFFENVIQRHFPNMRVIVGHVRDVIDGNNYVVTGDPADMLFGTFLMAQAFKGPFVRNADGRTVENPMSYKLEAPWQEIVPQLVHDQKLLTHKLRPSKTELQDLKQNWIDWITPFVQASPVPILNTFDFFWWVTYGLKYQHDLLRIYYNRDHDVLPTRLQCGHPDSRVYNFYQWPNFDQWSLNADNHRKLKMKDKRVWASYKFPMKQYIKDVCGDEQYFAAKAKCQSVVNAWGATMGIDERWNVIRFGKYSISRVQLQNKYGEKVLHYLNGDPRGGSRGLNEAYNDDHDNGMGVGTGMILGAAAVGVAAWAWTDIDLSVEEDIFVDTTIYNQARGGNASDAHSAGGG